MTEPKFSIGDRVAVCSSDVSIVIPVTEVIERRLWTHGKARIASTGKTVPVPECWIYRVAAHSAEFCEWALRPIRPDEYDETPTTTERGISA